jgi:hypothetical protein
MLTIVSVDVTSIALAGLLIGVKYLSVMAIFDAQALTTAG